MFYITLFHNLNFVQIQLLLLIDTISFYFFYSFDQIILVQLEINYCEILTLRLNKPNYDILHSSMSLFILRFMNINYNSTIRYLFLLYFGFLRFFFCILFHFQLLHCSLKFQVFLITFGCLILCLSFYFNVFLFSYFVLPFFKRSLLVTNSL